MKKRTLTLIILLFSGSCYAQELYEDRLDNYLDSLGIVYGENLKDSIWNHLFTDYIDYINNSRLGNYKLTTIAGDTIELDSFSTPIFLQATASWCRPCVEEIPALNEVVDRYADKVTFVLLTHDKVETAIQLREKLNKKIILIPSTDYKNIMNIVKLQIDKFKHILPFPTTYFSDINHILYAIRPGGLVAGEHYTKDEVFKLTIERFTEQLDLALENQK